MTHLILVTDASRKGCQVIQTIKKVADELVMYEKYGVVANRLPDKDMVNEMDIGGMPLLAEIEADKDLAACDMKGENVFYLSEDAKIVTGAREALRRLGIIG